MKEVTKSVVGEQSSPTVTVNQAAEDLADVVIAGVKKISSIIHEIEALKHFFEDGERDGNHRLKSRSRVATRGWSFATGILTVTFARSKSNSPL